MVFEARTHSFPGIPDSAGRAVIGLGLLAIPFVANAARHYLESSHHANQTISDLKNLSVDALPGDIVEAASYLEVGTDNELHFHGPDPGMPDITVFDNQNLTSPKAA